MNAIQAMTTTCARVPVAMGAIVVVASNNARPINSTSTFVMTGATSPIFGQTAEQINWTYPIHAIQVIATTCARVPVAMGAIVASNNARPINSTSTFVMTGATSAIFGQIVERIQLRKEQVGKT